MRLLRAGLVTGVSDALFSSVLAKFFYGSSVTRLWQGVAATAFGAEAFGGGNRLAIAGLLVHFAVAFSWSAIFLLLYQQLAALRRICASPTGVIAVAAVYGPLIWMVMSMVVIPSQTGRPPAITYRWWVQFVGHAIFVGLPIVSMISRRQSEIR